MTGKWYYGPLDNHARLGMQVRRRLVSEQSDVQKIELFEAERYGRVLALRTCPPSAPLGTIRVSTCASATALRS